MAFHLPFSTQFQQKPHRETEAEPVLSKDSRGGFQVHRISDACEKVHERFHTWLRLIAMHEGLGDGGWEGCRGERGCERVPNAVLQ